MWPKFDAVGGRVVVTSIDESPRWFKDNLGTFWGVVAHYNHGEATIPYESNGLPPFVGANMAFRRRCFEKYGLFREDLGLGTGSVGEDTEYFHRLQNAGAKMIYAGNVGVWHDISKDRYTLRYILRWYLMKARYLLREPKTFIGKVKALFFFGMMTMRKIAQFIRRCLGS